MTSVNINTGNAARPEQIFQAVAANKGLLKVLDLKNANIPAGETVRSAEQNCSIKRAAKHAYRR